MDAKVMEVDKLSDDTFEEHTFKEGSWKQDPKHNFDTRLDICTKCGLERNMLKSKHTDNLPVVATYWRGNMGFDREAPPLCWGQLNP